jgi:hypothetical protein
MAVHAELTQPRSTESYHAWSARSILPSNLDSASVFSQIGVTPFEWRENGSIQCQYEICSLRRKPNRLSPSFFHQTEDIGISLRTIVVHVPQLFQWLSEIKAVDHLTYVTECIFGPHRPVSFLARLANGKLRLLFHAPLEMIPPTPSRGVMKICSAFGDILCKVPQFLRGTWSPQFWRSSMYARMCNMELMHPNQSAAEPFGRVFGKPCKPGQLID